jgi:hypothetical protein
MRYGQPQNGRRFGGCGMARLSGSLGSLGPLLFRRRSNVNRSALLGAETERPLSPLFMRHAAVEAGTRTLPIRAWGLRGVNASFCVPKPLSRASWATRPSPPA